MTKTIKKSRVVLGQRTKKKKERSDKYSGDEQVQKSLHM